MKGAKMKKFETERFKFFTHKECEYFPCHEGIAEEDFNCLFCFCPLYTLGSECGGRIKYLEDGTKDCSDCLIPHRKGGYEYICNKWKEVSALADKE